MTALDKLLSLLKIGIRTPSGTEWLTRDQINKLPWSWCKEMLDLLECPLCATRRKFVFVDGGKAVSMECLCGNRIHIPAEGNSDKKHGVLDKEYEIWIV
jgi:hypothetical protein